MEFLETDWEANAKLLKEEVDQKTLKNFKITEIRSNDFRGFRCGVEGTVSINLQTKVANNFNQFANQSRGHLQSICKPNLRTVAKSICKPKSRTIVINLQTKVADSFN